MSTLQRLLRRELVLSLAPHPRLLQAFHAPTSELTAKGATQQAAISARSVYLPDRRFESPDFLKLAATPLRRVRLVAQFLRHKDKPQDAFVTNARTNGGRARSFFAAGLEPLIKDQITPSLLVSSYVHAGDSTASIYLRAHSPLFFGVVRIMNAKPP